MTSSPITYSMFIGPEKEGETRAMRHPDVAETPLRDVNQFGTKTTWEGLKNTVFNLKMGDRKFIGTRHRNEDKSLGDRYDWKTFREIYDISLSFGKGLEVLGLCPEIDIPDEGKFKFIGIYSKNREEWVVTDFGGHCNSVTTIPVYDTLGEIAMEHIFNLTKLTTISLEAKCYKKILDLANKGKTGNVKNLILMDPKEDPDTQNKLKEKGFVLYTMKDIIDKGNTDGKDLVMKEPTPDTIAIICFTSGTTGTPKGAMITHNNIMCEVSIITARGFNFSPDDIYLSFLPLAHVMERLIVSVCFSFGIAVGFFSGNPRDVINDAKVLRPTCMCSVPKIFLRKSFPQ